MPFGLKHRSVLPGVIQRELDQLIAAIREHFGVAHEEDGTLKASAVSVGLPVGLIMGFGGATVPSGWLLCDGRAISRTAYAALFLAIGTLWGAGDGSTTFNIPDGRGRSLLGKATAGTGSTLGGTFGALDHTHAGPSHTHGVSAVTVGTPSATTVVLAGVGSTVASDTHVHALSGTTDAGGTGNTSAANGPAFVGNWIIVVQ